MQRYKEELRRDKHVFVRMERYMRASKEGNYLLVGDFDQSRLKVFSVSQHKKYSQIATWLSSCIMLEHEMRTNGSFIL